ncbi:hypothetical protein ACR2XN_28420, partial [Klebsiella pneumoniae]
MFLTFASLVISILSSEVHSFFSFATTVSAVVAVANTVLVGTNGPLVIDLILQSLNSSYAQFVMNYNMNEIDKTPTELLAMLKTAETNIQKGSPAPIMMVNKGKAKENGKWKGKKKIGSIQKWS